MLVSTVTRSPPLIEDNAADNREKRKRKSMRPTKKRSEGSRITQDTAPGGGQEQEGAWGKKNKNIQEPNAVTRQVCEYKGTWGG